jgi:hypothetical protein
MRGWLVYSVAAVSIAAFTYVAWRSRSENDSVDSHCWCAICMANTMRDQITLYASHHHAFPAPDRLWEQMTRPTNTGGQTTAGPNSPEFPFGPYFESAPRNPLNNSFAVGSSPTPHTGWVYIVRGDTFIIWPVNETGDDLYINKFHRAPPKL